MDRTITYVEQIETLEKRVETLTQLLEKESRESLQLYKECRRLVRANKQTHRLLHDARNRYIELLREHFASNGQRQQAMYAHDCEMALHRRYMQNHEEAKQEGDHAQAQHWLNAASLAKQKAERALNL